MLACDKPGNHVIHLANGLRERRDGKIQEQALLFLLNGRAVVWIGDSSDYENWIADFVEGSGNRFPPGIEERLRRNRVGDADVTEQRDAVER